MNARISGLVSHRLRRHRKAYARTSMVRLATRFRLIVLCGMVAYLAASGAASAATESVLYSFCALGQFCTDGVDSSAGLIMDAVGNLYGTTEQGGAHGGFGTVFEVTPNAAKTTWTETVLYSFCAQGGENCTDGLGPLAGLIMDASGNLYGTTSGSFLESRNGPYIGGTVFELTPNMAKTTWTETVLYSFCAQSSCTDGSFPDAGLIVDAMGGLYGTTYYGGAHAGLLIPPLAGVRYSRSPVVAS